MDERGEGRAPKPPPSKLPPVAATDDTSVMRAESDEREILSPPGEERAHVQPHGRRPKSAFGIAALIFSCCGWIPISPIYYLGPVGVIFGCIELAVLRRDPQGPHSRRLAIASIAVGIVPLMMVLAGLLLQALLLQAIGSMCDGAGSGGGGKGSCPIVLSHDARVWTVDADPVSGALFEAGERTDRDRLESLAASDGTYRLRVANAIDQRDGINEVALEVVDHPEGEETLPTPTGELVRLRDAVAPQACRDEFDRDLRLEFRDADGKGYCGQAEDFDPDVDEAPRLAVDLSFPRPLGEGRLLLLLRARNTRFAADAFADYLSRMGSVALALMHRAEDCSWYPYSQRLSDEIDRAGLRLDVSEGPCGRGGLAMRIDPVGPAVLRSFAVPLSGNAAKDGCLRVRLEWSPLLWEIDQARLGRESGPAVVAVLRPRAAHGPDGDATAALAAADGARVYLAPGETVEVEFDAPPAPPTGTARTVCLRLRGWYILDPAGFEFFDPVAFFRHHTGRDSLPRHALRLARAPRQGQ